MYWSLPKIVEHAAGDDIPVAFAHCTDERGVPQSLKPLLVIRIVVRERRVILEPAGDELPPHASLCSRHMYDLERGTIINKSLLDPVVPHVPWVTSRNYSRELAFILLRDLQTAETNAAAQEPVNRFREARQLVGHQYVDLGALVLVNILLVLTVT